MNLVMSFKVGIDPAHMGVGQMRKSGHSWPNFVRFLCCATSNAHSRLDCKQLQSTRVNACGGRHGVRQT